MDPLSDVLSLLKLRSHVSSGFEAGGTWSVQFARHEGFIKCYAIVKGRCWLAVDGIPDAIRLEAGDCFLLPGGRPFRLASDLTATPVNAEAIFSGVRGSGGVAVCNGGGDFFLVGSRFGVAGNHAGILLGMLPPIVHIRNASDQAALRWSIERMMEELREPKPGGFLVADHLAHMMLLLALRLQVTGGRVGWLFALADHQIGAAINAMHDDPAHGWTVDALAKRAFMSRSTFALKFKAMVGVSPMEYLTRWRMLLAGDRLASSRDSISLVAQSLGYESESAFSTAFKRVMGRAPRQYSRELQPASS
jgi:AraC-like DNA-binding protein